MTTTTRISPSQPTLSFPRETFAKLSPHPYLLAHLQPSDSSPSLRANGRSPARFRAPHINNSSLTYAEGSAVVRLGDTTAVCGIRGEILLVTDVPDYRGPSPGDKYNEAKELDLLVPNIELATGCSPAFLPGQPPSTLAQSLSTRIYSLLHSSRLVDAEDLRIWYQPPVISATEQKGSDDEEEDKNETAEREVKAFWTLYIDVLFISLDGNPFDTAWAAVLCALRDVRLPSAYWDIDRQMILCSDELSQSKKLNLQGIPIACTYTIFQAKERNIQVHHGEGDSAKYWVLADPDTFEESLCEETVTVVVDCSQPGEATRVLGISKSGGSVVGRGEMRDLVEMASKRWGEWHGVLTKAP